MKTTLALIAAALLTSCVTSCVTTRVDPDGTRIVWSAANCPEEWDKALSPLDSPRPALPLLRREDPLYWNKVFDPSNH